MNSGAQAASPSSVPLDKGKGRATETTPLLPDAGRSNTPQVREDTETIHARRGLLPRILRIFLISLSLALLAFVIFALLVWSYASQASKLAPEDIIDNAVVLDGPYTVDVINTTESGGLWVNVRGRVGVDAGVVLGVKPSKRDGLFVGAWKGIGRWGVNTLNLISVEVDHLFIKSSHGDLESLATITLPPLDILLTANPPNDLSWLREMSTQVLIEPSHNTTVLQSFLQDSWNHGAFQISVLVPSASVTGGVTKGHDWRNAFGRTISKVQARLSVNIPPIPGLPTPGPGAPFPSISELVTLTSFNLYPLANRLAIKAQATTVDPAPLSINVTTPEIPFIISVPWEATTIPIASVFTHPFTLTHPNITLDISGHVLTLPDSASPLLSNVVSNYLSGLPNSISISSPLVPLLEVDAVFPGPNPRPELLHNVTIKDMKLKAVGTGFVASGAIFARLVLPRGLDLDMDVKSILPDALIYDGEAPIVLASTTRGPPDAPPLPDPLPERAFARIRPDDWVDADCSPDISSDDEGSAFFISAKIVEVPLQVLPGRAQEFSNFISKVLWTTEGALAGIVGTTGVQVDIIGLPIDHPKGSGLELGGIPFRGSVKIQKKGVAFTMDRLRHILHWGH